MKRLAYLPMLALLLAGCGGSGETSNNYPSRLSPTPEAVNRATKSLSTGKAKSVTAAANAFGFSLLRELAKKEPNKNLFISPSSISIALTMAYNGAEGGTKTAMERTLGIAGMTVREVNDANKDLRTLLAAPDKGVRIDIANSLWAKQGVDFKREFLGRNEDYFGAKVTALDFSKEEAPDAINVWVSEATQEKIKQIVDKIPPEMVMYLIDAVYFKGAWEKPFDPKQTMPREFTVFDGKKKEVPFMQRAGEFETFKAEKFEAVRLPYGTGRIGMFVFLPNGGVPVGEVVKQLDAKNWDGWIPKIKKLEGSVALPKFKAEYSAALKDTLAMLGMGEAFDPDKANFSGMAADMKLYLTSVGHKTFVEVNEEGTEAAAVTDVGVGVTAAPAPPKERLEFVANRPFVYGIVDQQTGTVLFLGIMGDPVPERGANEGVGKSGPPKSDPS